MWVRSQNLEKLVNANRFDIEPIYEISRDINGKRESKPTDGYSIECGLTPLGIYSSKMNAITVLTMIEHCISGRMDDYEKEFYNGVVFQMPKDSEVE